LALRPFGTLPNTGDAADGADPDGDGSTNAQEYSAGTNPNDGSSFFRITSATKVGETTSITFPTIAGKTYALKFSTTLDGTWTVVQTTGGPAENIVGTGSPVQIIDAGPLGPKRFYRAEVLDSHP
jgi:hypothetical protein